MECLEECKYELLLAFDQATDFYHIKRIGVNGVVESNDLAQQVSFWCSQKVLNIGLL
jgi:hypothetical protein